VEVPSMADSTFWEKVHTTAAKATWAYLATVDGDQPKVRVVHPAFEGERVWVATGSNSAKARHIGKNAKVELFYQVAPPDMIHLTVTGSAKFVADLKEKKRIWDGKIFDYDLAQFWPAGAEAKDFGLMLVTPSRIELTSLGDMSVGKKPAVWRAEK
jgi:general stress protein 26